MAIDINQLKAGGTSGLDASTDNIVDPNLGKNIDGKELQDFGNGLKEFDPAANGFKPEEIDRGEADDQKALRLFDEQLEQRQKEVEEFNDLIEASGGQVSEAEVREAMGQNFVTDMLQDGEGGKFEDETNIKAPAPEEEVKNASDIFNEEEKVEDSEIDELERELEDMDNQELYSENTTPIKSEPVDQENTTPGAETIPVSKVVNKETVEVQPVVAATSKATTPDPTMNVKASEVDEDGKSQEDKDLEALENGDDSDDSEDFETKLKRELQKKLKPVSKKLDLSSTTIIQRPVNVTHLLERRKQSTRRVFTWPLIDSGRPVTMQSFNANELNTLSNNARNSNMTLEVFRTIYKHIVSAKGESFEQWCKTTSYFDLDHIWMAVYGACFADSNYLPFSCDKCNDVTVTTNTPIMDMVKFKNDEVKEKFNKIMEMKDSDPSMGSVTAEHLVQVSDDIVIGFIKPTLYSSIVENSMYDGKIRDDYSDIVNIISYIGNIYAVDEGGIRPINTKVYPNNEAKTAKARVIQYAKIIRNLTSDEYGIIMAHILELGRVVDDITYQLPETTCDHCKATIPADPQEASSLVFTRHQLVMFGI